MGKDLKGKQLGVGLNQRKDGRYQARLTTKNGKRLERNFIKLPEAKEWLLKQKYLNTIVDTGNMTVNEWYHYWITNYKNGIVKYNTVRNYKYRYQFNIQPSIGDMKLSDVKQIHCQSILNSMYDSGKYAKGTLQHTKITLHALFKDAVANNYIAQNPASDLKLKQDIDTTEISSNEKRVLTREEQRIFKEYSQNSIYYNIYCLLLETGMRAGEVGGLQWTDVDLQQKMLHVNRTLLQDTTKGGFVFGTPKTKTSRRIIPLTNEAIRILEDQRRIQQKLKLKSKRWCPKFDDLVFTTRNGNPVCSSAFRRAMNRIVDNINFDRQYNHELEFQHCDVHSLRHTFATRCIEAGMQPKTLQKILGHSTINTTMDLYVHVTEEQLYHEVEKINNIAL